MSLPAKILKMPSGDNGYYKRGKNMTELWMRIRRKWCFVRGNERGVKRFSNMISSRRAVVRLQACFDESVPPEVNVEINTNCNYACPFCPQSSCKRPVQYMTREVFEVLIKRLEAIDYAGHVCLSVNNEPFLHPLILEFCETISKRLPKARGGLISNGALITKEHLLALAKLDLPPRLQINDYTSTRSVSKRIETMFAQDPILKRIPLTVSLREIAERLSNRAGNQPGCGSDVGDYQDIVCTWPFMGLFLTPDLQFFLCCSDYHHKIILGDLIRESLMDIWQGEPYRDLRKRMLASARKGIPLCSGCDADWFCLPEHCSKKEDLR